jgi:hypothetical protein
MYLCAMPLAPFHCVFFAERDSSGWNLDEGEVQRRRILFWEMYTADSWTVMGSFA